MKHILLFLFVILNDLYLPAQAILSKTVDSLLQTQFKPNEPGGVVMIATKGAIVYKKAFGLANLELSVPANDSMIFYIGSNTKQFTAAAILQLMEKGKLSLQDSLGRFVPTAPPAVSRITVQQLLSHTSGIHEKNEKSIKALIFDEHSGNQVPIEVAAGTTWEYNNTNYSLLGYIIEKTTGKLYADYIKENIFQPAGMTHSYIDDEVSIIPNRAPGYRKFKSRFLHSRPSGKIGAAGGIQSTVTDLFKWNMALKSGLLLKPETLQQAYRPQKLSDGTHAPYGFGWHLGELHGSPTRRHGGMVPGYTSETIYLPEEDIYVVMLTNTEFSAIPVPALSRIVAGLAINKPYIFDDRPIDQDVLKKYVGLYENSLGEQLNITEQKGSLVFQRPNGAPYKLGYAEDNEFFLCVHFVRINFVAAPDGKISSLITSVVDIGATEWFKTQKPLLNLFSERVADSLLQQYEGTYFSAKDTVIISRDGPNLYLTTGDERLLLAAAGNTRFFTLKGDWEVRFVKEPVTNNLQLLIIRKNKRSQYHKQ